MFARLITIFTWVLVVGSAFAANNALNVNPVVADADLTTHGSDFLWAVFAIMLASALGVTVWAFLIPAGNRAFHWIGIAILFTASIAYFSLASDLGSTPVYVEFVRYRKDLFIDRSVTRYTRSIWYARYIDWTITTPLLLLELLLTTGMPLSGIFATIFFDLVMIIAGLIGALVPTSYKWGYYTGGCIAMLYIFWTLIVPARANAKAISIQAHTAYIRSALFLAVLWFLYPIAWGLADGGNVISTDGEMIFYGVLDVLAKPVFLIFHLLALRAVPYELFQLQSGHFSQYAAVGLGDSKHGIRDRDTHSGPTPAPATGHSPAIGQTAVPSASVAREVPSSNNTLGSSGLATQPSHVPATERTSDANPV